MSSSIVYYTLARGVDPVCVIPVNSGGYVDLHNLVDNGLTDSYALYFLNGRLQYWGYPHEFNRDLNPKINMVGKEIGFYMGFGRCSPRKRF